MSTSQKWEWKAMVVCFIVSAIFWGLNSLNKDYTTVIRYPIEVQAGESTTPVVAVSPVPSYVTLQVTGNGWEILKSSLGFGLEPVKIVVDNPIGRKSILAESIFAQIAMNFKNDVVLHKLEEDTLHVEYNKIVSRVLTLAVKHDQVALREGFALASKIKLSTEKVKFTGASSYIRQLPDTLYLKLSDKNIDANYEENITISYPFEEFVYGETETVEVGFAVEKLENIEIPTKILLKNDSRFNPYELVDKQAIVRATVIKSLADSLKKDTLNLQVDYKLINLNDLVVEPRLMGPSPALKNIEIVPSAFKVTKKKK